MSSEDRSRYSPSSNHPEPLFVDTSAIFASTYQKDNHYHDASEVFAAIKNGTVLWGPLITNDYILDETFTILEKTRDKSVALDIINGVYSGELFKVIHVDRRTIETTRSYVQNNINDGKFDGMSFTDWVVYVQMKEHQPPIDHVFTYNRRDFSPLDVTVIPHYEL